MENSRRRALKKLGVAAGAGVVASSEWAKPVIKGVIAPAHAQTTSATFSFSVPDGVSHIEETIFLSVVSETDLVDAAIRVIQGENSSDEGTLAAGRSENVYLVQFGFGIGDLDTDLNKVDVAVTLNGETVTTTSVDFAPAEV